MSSSRSFVPRLLQATFLINLSLAVENIYMHLCDTPIVSPLGVSKPDWTSGVAANPKDHQIQCGGRRWIDGHMTIGSHQDKLLLLAQASSESLDTLRPHGYLLKDELLYGFGKSQCFHFFLSHLAFWSLLSGFTPIFGLVLEAFFPLTTVELKEKQHKEIKKKGNHAPDGFEEL